MEIEYWRNQKQRMNYERFVAANSLALITHTLVSTTPSNSEQTLVTRDPNKKEL